jgi:hypothetical protein
VDNAKMDLREVERGGLYWIGLAEDRDQWRALVTTVMNIWVLQMLWRSWVGVQLPASEEGLRSTKLVFKQLLQHHMLSQLLSDISAIVLSEVCVAALLVLLMVTIFFYIFGQPRTLLQLKLVGILMINLFLT